MNRVRRVRRVGGWPWRPPEFHRATHLPLLLAVATVGLIVTCSAAAVGILALFV